MSAPSLSERLVAALRYERRTSEFAKIEIDAQQIEMEPKVIAELAQFGVCSHFEKREYFFKQNCDLTKALPNCTVNFQQSKPNRWVFSECPLKGQNGLFPKSRQ